VKYFVAFNSNNSVKSLSKIYFYLNISIYVKMTFSAEAQLAEGLLRRSESSSTEQNVLGLRVDIGRPTVPQKGRADFGSFGSVNDGKCVWRALGISSDGKLSHRYR
jgi:hypothetical protein